MASGGQAIEDNLKTFLDKTCTDNMMTLTQAKKCFDQAKLAKYKSVLESSCWVLHQNTAKKVATKVVAGILLEDLAVLHVMRAKNLRGRKEEHRDNPAVATCLEEIRAALSLPSAACAKTVVKVDKATERLTDTSSYTGSHKERFGTDGKGKGIEGRKEMASNDGYVGNYKGKGTYDTK